MNNENNLWRITQYLYFQMSYNEQMQTAIYEKLWQRKLRQEDLYELIRLQDEEETLVKVFHDIDKLIRFGL